MKSYLKKIGCLCLMAGLLAGCSMNDTAKEDMNKVNKSTEKAADDTKKAADKAKTTTEDSIDNVMNYFTTKGIAYNNMQAIENMDFAAYEGRSFMMNDKTAYLYRVKSDDESMKKVMDEAKNNGKVKVKVDGKEQEYGAQVNGDYLLLYDTTANTADLQKAFPNYQPTGVHGSNANEDMNGTGSSTENNTTNDMTD
ncbi:MAG: hypothetical protein RR690_05055 [Longicatena sp.]